MTQPGATCTVATLTSGISPTPTATSTPQPTATPTPSPTASPSPEPTPTPEPQSEPFPATMVIASIASVAIIGSGLLVYSKKRKH